MLLFELNLVERKIHSVNLTDQIEEKTKEEEIKAKCQIKEFIIIRTNIRDEWIQCCVSGNRMDYLPPEHRENVLLDTRRAKCVRKDNRVTAYVDLSL